MLDEKSSPNHDFNENVVNFPKNIIIIVRVLLLK